MTDSDNDLKMLRGDFLGQELSGILFIRDYIEFQFEEKRIQFFADPIISTPNGELRFRQKGASDYFIGLIDKSVTALDYMNGHYKFTFDDHVSVCVRDGGSVAGETFNTVTAKGIGVF